jgi:hypothetical protein
MADLSRADLSGANLAEADLSGATLSRADLSGANLAGTVLDPKNKPNANVTGFVRDGDYVVGYRTDVSYANNDEMRYEVGKTYTAPVFSTCDTECHPGIYLFPTIDAAGRFVSGREWRIRVIEVKAKATDVHKAGEKWRAKEITVTRIVGTTGWLMGSLRQP